jgi:hypothetical protein
MSALAYAYRRTNGAIECISRCSTCFGTEGDAESDMEQRSSLNIAILIVAIATLLVSAAAIVWGYSVSQNDRRVTQAVGQISACRSATVNLEGALSQLANVVTEHGDITASTNLDFTLDDQNAASNAQQTFVIQCDDLDTANYQALGFSFQAPTLEPILLLGGVGSQNSISMLVKSENQWISELDVQQTRVQSEQPWPLG